MSNASLQTMIYIIDDDEALREALDLLLESVDLPHQIFSTADDFLSAIDNASTDFLAQQGCIISDVRMPGKSGIALQAELRQRQITLPIIFITGHGDITMAVGAIQAGAVDFLQKPFREQELLDSIDKALSRQVLKQDSEPELVEYESGLTPKEAEVLKHLRQGKAGKVIAAELSISPKTLDIHRSRILKKFGVPSIQRLLALYSRPPSS